MPGRRGSPRSLRLDTRRQRFLARADHAADGPGAEEKNDGNADVDAMEQMIDGYLAAYRHLVGHLVGHG